MHPNVSRCSSRCPQGWLWLFLVVRLSHIYFHHPLYSLKFLYCPWFLWGSFQWMFISKRQGWAATSLVLAQTIAVVSCWFTQVPVRLLLVSPTSQGFKDFYLLHASPSYRQINIHEGRLCLMKWEILQCFVIHLPSLSPLTSSGPFSLQPASGATSFSQQPPNPLNKITCNPKLSFEIGQQILPEPSLTQICFVRMLSAQHWDFSRESLA